MAAFNMGDLLGALNATTKASDDMEMAISEVKSDLTRRKRVSGLTKQERDIQDKILMVEKDLKAAGNKLARLSRMMKRERRHNNNMHNMTNTDREFRVVEAEIAALHIELNGQLAELKRVSEAASMERRETKREKNMTRRRERAAEKKFQGDLNDIIGMMSGMPTNYARRSRSRSPAMWRNRSRSRSRSRSRRSRSRSPRRGGATRRRGSRRNASTRRRSRK